MEAGFKTSKVRPLYHHALLPLRREQKLSWLGSEPGQQGSESQILTTTYFSHLYIFYLIIVKIISLIFFRMYQSQKKSKEALPHYQEALEYIEISRGEKSLECVSILRELAGVEQSLGFYDASINHFLQVSYNILATKALLPFPVLFIDTSGIAPLRMPGFVICSG